MNLLSRYRRFILIFVAIILFFIYVYPNLNRIIWQILYMHGIVKTVYGNDLEPLGTYYIHRTLYEPQKLKDLEKEPVHLLIMISSSPYNINLRDAIRKTWGKCNKLKTSKQYKYIRTCQLVFYMGKGATEEHVKLNVQEMKTFNDIIIGDFIDSYKNMTRKILFALNWSSQKFIPNYVLKTDDDVFMDVPKLINLLDSKYSYLDDLYGGFTYYAMVHRDSKHRHYLTRQEYPNDWYPPYNKGSQLILSGHLLDKLIAMSTQVKRFQIDDAYIGILMNRISVIPTKVSEFIQNQYVSHIVDWLSSCDMESIVGIGDSLTPRQITLLHKMAQSAVPWYCIRHVVMIYLSFFIFCSFSLVLYLRKRKVFLYPFWRCEN